MSVAEFISSGTLELFVLDELSPKERLEVTMIAQKYPEVQNEIESIESIYEQIALNQAITPSDKILEEIRNKVELEVTSSSQAQNWSWIGIAATLAFLTISSFSIFQFLEITETEKELGQLKNLNQELMETTTSQSIQQEILSSQLALITDPSTEEIQLNGLEISPSSSASVFWNTEEEILYLNPEGLPSTPNEKQFQLWAIVDGAPLSLGLIDGNIGLLEMKFVSEASAFAITLEPKGGSESPTLNQMYVMGTS